MRLLSIGEAADPLGVAVGTLRRWHRQGRLPSAGRTVDGHRRYLHDALRASLGTAPALAGKTVCDARVASHDQAEQLKTQAARLEKHYVEAGFADVGVVTDLGSGLNYRKKGLQRLLMDHLRGRLARLAANVPGICFGTRKLLGQQHHLELARFDRRGAWLREWQARRSHQVFFVGSKDETAGNQLCQLQRTADGAYALKIRVPDRLLSPRDDRYLVICDVIFDYDRAALGTALEANVALSWRLHRDERGWRAFVSFNHPAAEKSSLDVAHGATGIDFNVDHLAVTETDPFATCQARADSHCCSRMYPQVGATPCSLTR
ncbi:MerR family regulatory protein [Paraburkholderia aspalathi]|uniref:MerR family regulatory protein n=1 Tax=Paraburkholderia aspalathi TaxID=1324617 RepID=A0A1I7EPN9_9BURK|nr:MerR family DNA-binding transcriptional regulator [Paraburkholderia aspalathi]SFU25896.1 MerR family regulatory protein [Paraburkholderia aspalathi]